MSPTTYLRTHTGPNMMQLKPIQQHALDVLAAHGGLVGSIGVGSGKTLIGAMAGTVLGVERVLLILPANLRTTLYRELDKYDVHGLPITRPNVMSYAELSGKSGLQTLKSYRPQLVVLDECHMLRSPRAARTKRFGRWRKSNPDVPMVAMSGTLMSRSILDYAHIIRWVLGDASPLPGGYHVLESWASIIDVINPHRYATADDWYKFRRLYRQYGVEPTTDRKTARETYHRHLQSHPAIVMTSGLSYGGAIHARHLVHTPSQPLVDAIECLELDWVTPGGEYLTTALELSRHLRTLAVGFYNWLDWPDGNPDEEYLYLRSEWEIACRAAVARLSRRGIDTPGLLTDAIEDDNPLIPMETVDAYRAWTDVVDRYELSDLRRTTWLDDSLLRRVVDVCAAHGTLVWYSNLAVADRLGELGMHVCYRNDLPPEDATTCAVSIRAHGTGKNLQHYHTNVVLQPPSSGQVWEQLIGRTHRSGQTADPVRLIVANCHPTHTNALHAAHKAARVIQTTKGQPQRLLKCLWFGVDTDPCHV